MLASGFILIILKGLTEFFYEQALYKRCVSIIEYALILAEENQKSEQKNLQKIKPSNNIMKALRKHKIDKQSDFDYNS